MIDKNLLDEIKEYCDLNELSLENTINKAVRGGFTTLKYGATPISAKSEVKPVEVIKTVEKVVEKIVKVSDNTKTNELLKEIEKLKKNVSDYKGMFESAKLGLEECNGNNKLLELEVKKNRNNEKDMYGESD